MPDQPRVAADYVLPRLSCAMHSLPDQRRLLSYRNKMWSCLEELLEDCGDLELLPALEELLEECGDLELLPALEECGDLELLSAPQNLAVQFGVLHCRLLGNLELLPAPQNLFARSSTFVHHDCTIMD